jgi:hypothetical protein
VKSVLFGRFFKCHKSLILHINIWLRKCL